MQFQHPNQRWDTSPLMHPHTQGLITSGSGQSNSPTDMDNNNAPVNKNQSQITKIGNNPSPLNSTISAAADSSDNQPSPPNTGVGGNPSDNVVQAQQQQQQQQQQVHFNSLPTAFGQESYHPTFLSGYDNQPSYGYPPYGHHPMEYSPLNHYNFNNPVQHEYKTVPSRFPHIAGPPTLPPNGQSHLHQIQAMQPPHTQSNGSPSHNSIGSAMSPRIGSSSSPAPTQHNNGGMSLAGTPTSIASVQSDNKNRVNSPSTGHQRNPTPVTLHCPKCGYACQSTRHLNEHISILHPGQENLINGAPNGSSLPSANDMQNYPYQQPPLIKEEHPSDILDLDSQKMVYPPHEHLNPGLRLPSMHSLHAMHQRPLATWDTAPTDYMAAHQSYPNTMMKPGFEQPLNPQATAPTNPHTDAPSTFANEQTGNQSTRSPPDFPSTTTPQENAFRSFEATSSSLPTNPTTAKSTTWKSNEARRPKTYNCSACNKWFTSSGHLKRHYNTTLHKNAVKTSGKVDPATLPINTHHYPQRDPNSKHNRQKQQQAAKAAQQKQTVATVMPTNLVAEPQQTADYTTQFTPNVTTGGFVPPPQNQYTQYGNSIHGNGHPNGQAGPSVIASNPRDLLNYTNDMESIQQPLIQDPEGVLTIHQTSQHQETISHTIINSVPDYPIINHTDTSINIIPSYQDIQDPQELELPNYPITIGRMELDQTINNNIVFNEFEFAIAMMQNKTQEQEYQHHQQQQQQLLQNQNQHQLQQQQQQQQQTMCQPQPDILYRAMENSKLMEPVVTTTTSQKSQSSVLYSPPYSMQSSPPAQISINIPNEGGDKPINTPLSSPSSLNQRSNSSSPVTDSMDHDSVVLSNLQNVQHPLQPIQEPQYMIPEPLMYDAEFRVILSPDDQKENSLADKKLTNKVKKSVSKKSIAAQKKKCPVSQNGYELGPDGQPKHRCDPCNKVFTKVCYLTQHQSSVHSKLPLEYRCTPCGKRFAEEYELIDHLAKHTCDKPFKCNVDGCEKRFNHKTDLTRHIHSIHNLYKPFECSLCKKGFVRKDHMNKHTETHLRKVQREEARAKSALLRKEAKLRAQDERRNRRKTKSASSYELDRSNDTL